MINDLKRNVNVEIGMLREIANYSRRINWANPSEKKLLLATIESLRKSMKIVNNSIPRLLSEIVSGKVLPSQTTRETARADLEKVSYKRVESQFEAVVPKQAREELLKELSISDKYIRKLKKKEIVGGEEYKEFKAVSGYLKFSNKLFFNTTNKWINKGYFKRLSVELRKANIEILFPTYVSMIFTTTLISFFISLLFTVFLFFFNIHLDWPAISFYSGSYLLRLAKIFWIPLFVPCAVFTSVYYYPITEKKSLARKIDQELPFAVIHMSAISGSGIEPSEIFRIIGLSKEYSHLRKEIRKILNQINLYGYDLVAALSSVSKSTPSTKLSELFSGLSTTIQSGGDLSEFFGKRAETLLVSYRLEREKYAKTAETFMDIYISVVIAAPMILMLLLIIMTVANFSIGFTTSQITFLIIAVITLINVLFIAVLHVYQPNY